MPRYSVHASVYASKYLGEYEAANEEEAIKKALDENGHVNLCHQCTEEAEDPEIGECTAEEVKK